jgi:stage II sporulation protein D
VDGMRRLIVATALCLAFAASSASASTVYVVSGRGFGHGVGMSQYGAYGYALHHSTYRRILSHYYRGTRLARVHSRAVRVLLQRGGAISFSGASSVNGKRLDPGTSYVATPIAGGGTDVRDSNGHDVQRFGPGALYVSGGGSFTLGGTALNGLSGGRYRGQLELAADGGALDAIDVVSLENYVAGVVSAEMISIWPAEALKAQAVAARTYALATDAGGGLFDQYADTRSQEYKGIAAEYPSSNAAVRATAGQVVTYRGQLATTFFFDSSGGRTEDVQNVMYGSPPEPYLVSVKDPYDALAPQHKWRFRWSGQQLQAKLGSLCAGSFNRIKVLRRGRSPRIVSANVVCSQGTHPATGVELKAALGLYDTWFYVTRVDTAGGHRARAASFVSQLLVPRRELRGRFDPAPPGRRLTVEREVHGHFRPIGEATTSPDGAFDYPLTRPGTYRVSWGDADGPAVGVR